MLKGIKWATVDPSRFGKYRVQNLVKGVWKDGLEKFECVDPLQGGPMLEVGLLGQQEVAEVTGVCRGTPKSGLHNPIRNVARYNQYG
jgi:1-pyrroline-5-carboxylate dehydrogenase